MLWTTGLCRLCHIGLSDGMQMRFFPTSLSASLWADPAARKKEEQPILDLLREGDTCIDVGANVGHFALLAAQRVGPSGKVIVIEAHPRTFDFLCQNFQLNSCQLQGLRHIRLIHAAVGSRAGETSISDFRADDMNHLGQNESIKVPQITLDSLEITGRVKLLKTDTEGFEPFVFEGARDLLNCVNCIYFECSEWNLNRYGRKSHELRTILESAGFDIYPLDQSSPIPLQRDYDATTGGNLLALRKS
jgi:FkbM family methyltransferase